MRGSSLSESFCVRNFLFRIVSDVVNNVENRGASVPKRWAVTGRTPFQTDPLQRKRIFDLLCINNKVLYELPLIQHTCVYVCTYIHIYTFRTLMYRWPCHLTVGMDTGIIRKGFIRHFHVYSNVIALAQPWMLWVSQSVWSWGDQHSILKKKWVYNLITTFLPSLSPPPHTVLPTLPQIPGLSSY